MNYDRSDIEVPNCRECRYHIDTPHHLSSYGACHKIVEYWGVEKVSNIILGDKKSIQWLFKYDNKWCVRCFGSKGFFTYPTIDDKSVKVEHSDKLVDLIHICPCYEEEEYPGEMISHKKI